MLVQVSVGSERTSYAVSADAHLSSTIQPAPTKELGPNEILFHVGDPRDCLYRVESGSICIYEPHLEWGHAVIDFAFPGDFVGLGFLKNQTSTARAMMKTHVARLPIALMDSLVAGDPKAEAKLAQAIEKEFELHRTSLVEAGRHNPVERVAALLLALSQINRHEGRDPNVIAASWHCGLVAAQLELSIDDLAQMLLDLEALGLIEACPVSASTQGLRIKDHNRLEGIAAGGRSNVFVGGSASDRARLAFH